MIILSVDLGKARTGLAVCDRQEILASPVEVITEYHSDRLCERICAVARERGAELIVVGLPRNMDGSEGESARSARQFADALHSSSALPVDMQDERGTTITAHNYLNETNTRGKKRKETVDAVAAVIILEAYMARRKNAAQRESEQQGIGSLSHNDT